MFACWYSTHTSYSIAGNGDFAAVNAGGALLSDDYGVTWSRLTDIPGTSAIFAVAMSANGQYIFVGDVLSSNIWTSSNGTTKVTCLGED